MALREQHKEKWLKELIIYANRGRDIFPWLDLQDKLKNYRIAGHFHTKRTTWTHQWIGDSWMEEILESLIDPVGEILEYFEKHKETGIVIPDIPFCHRLAPEADIWLKNRAVFISVWTKLKCKKALDAGELSTPIMPYGNMFWYRPDALQPLFDLHLKAEDFPGEPLPPDGTLAHAIERLPVYIAWSQGYDFRIASGINNLSSGFGFKIETERMDRIFQSTTWRIGRIFTFLPGKIRAFFKSE